MGRFLMYGKVMYMCRTVLHIFLTTVQYIMYWYGVMYTIILKIELPHHFGGRSRDIFGIPSKDYTGISQQLIILA